jgi:hypothetical protein
VNGRGNDESDADDMDIDVVEGSSGRYMMVRSCSQSKFYVAHILALKNSTMMIGW